MPTNVSLKFFTRIFMTLEAQIQSETLRSLKGLGYHAFRLPLGNIRMSGKSHIPNPMKGFPDILIFLKNKPGVVAWIEFKTKTGKVSDSQKNIHSILNALGCPLLIARSSDMAIEWIKEIDVLF